MSLLIFCLILLLMHHLISFMNLTIAHIVLVHERIALCPDTLVMTHVLIMVIVPYVGTIFLLEDPTLALSQDTWTVHIFPIMVHVSLMQVCSQLQLPQRGENTQIHQNSLPIQSKPSFNPKREVRKETPKPSEEVFICMFCGHVGHLDEFFFHRNRIENRRFDYTRNLCHGEFIDFLHRTSSRASSSFFHGPKHRSYGFSL
jgi:hypothetical protein